MSEVIKIKFSQIIKRRWMFVTAVTLLVVLLSLVFTLIQPFRYESQTKILIDLQAGPGMDAYSASKAAERVGRNLSQIFYTSSFLSKVLNSGFYIDKAYFPADETKKLSEWQKMVSTNVAPGSQIMQISVFHPDREQSLILIKALTSVLLKEGKNYISAESFKMTVLDEPTTSTYPVKPDVMLNLILGFVAGLFLAIAIILVTFSEEEEVSRLVQTHHRQFVASSAEEPASLQPPVKITEAPDISHLPQINFDQTPQTIAPQFKVTQPGATPDKKSSKIADLPKFGDEDQIKTFHDRN
jgi:capsular polysaccharide biosynthesis protein